MNITAVPSPAAALHTMRMPEAKEGPGPDHDGDADDKSVTNATSSPSTLPKGTGAALDTQA